MNWSPTSEVSKFGAGRGSDTEGAGARKSRPTTEPHRRVEATTTPEGAKGWVDRTGSAQVPAGGHGLDVAPDAHPEGVRAETRCENDRVGGEPSNAPAAADVLADGGALDEAIYEQTVRHPANG